MKKFFAVSLVFIMMLCATACSASKDNGAGSSSDLPESALAFLNSVWDKYTDDEKFPVAGGDYSEENNNMNGPGKYSIDDPEAIDASLGYPAASINQIDDAASIMHMMNANNFTCGVYHLKDGANPIGVAEEVMNNISARQWMCGFPERMFIATVDAEYVISAFGSEDNISTFKDKLIEIYPNAETFYDEPVE